MHDDLVCLEGWRVSGFEGRIGAYIAPDATSRPRWPTR